MKYKVKYTFLYLSMFVYMMSVIGVTINKHFCEGELEAITFIKQSTCCEGETEDDPDDCCSNETIYLANTTESINNSVKINFDPGVYALYCNNLVKAFTFSEVFVPTAVLKNTLIKPPLIKKEDPSTLMVFRI